MYSRVSTKQRCGRPIRELAASLVADEWQDLLAFLLFLAVLACRQLTGLHWECDCLNHRGWSYSHGPAFNASSDGGLAKSALKPLRQSNSVTNLLWVEGCRIEYVISCACNSTERPKGADFNFKDLFVAVRIRDFVGTRKPRLTCDKEALSQPSTTRTEPKAWLSWVKSSTNATSELPITNRRSSDIERQKRRQTTTVTELSEWNQSVAKMKVESKNRAKQVPR